jgi:ABC-2 type transport system ATP-binding protein
MEDVRSLCPRSVVIGKGKKVYDGDTDKLFSAYQTKKKIRLQFSTETDFTVPEDCAVIEQSPLKVTLSVPKEKSNMVLERLMGEFELSDISIEEEDIGLIVEKIYNAKAGVEHE